MSTLNRRRRHRRGNVIVLFCVLMPVIVGLVALALDVGVLRLARSEAQLSADAAALAAAWELIDEGALQGESTMTQAASAARDTADQWAAQNRVFGAAPRLAANPDDSADGDAVVGTIVDFADPSSPLTTDDPDTYNAVQVRVRRTAEQNGRVPLFFAQIWGFRDSPVEAQATAGIVRDVKGFRIPDDGSNAPILPFTLREATWNELLAGDGRDQWTWDSDEKAVESGSDGILEVNMYPLDTGASGNFGSLNIGRSNNGLGALSRQTREGLSEADLEPYGGSLELENGELPLTGDPGISAAIGRDLEAIRGELRILPLYREVSGNGSNATFTIVKFVGIRILDINLQGNPKYLTIQPANIVTKGIVAGKVGDNSSEFVYSKPYLVR